MTSSWLIRRFVRSVRRAFRTAGVDLVRYRPGAADRPVGDMLGVLQGLRARGLRCSFILDVGANRGEWSRTAHSVFPEARFLLIEPQEEMRGSLDAFCSEVTDSRWVLGGAAAQQGEMVLSVWEDLLGSSFLPEVSEAAGSAGRQRRVPVMPIDELLGEDLPQLVKLDIQGFELEALRGAGRLFGPTEAFILEISLFEFMPRQPVLLDVVTFMAERGYVVYDFAGFLRRPYDGALGQVDICFVKRDGFLRAVDAWSAPEGTVSGHP